MKAKKVFEKFTEDSDPIKDMGIGNPEKSIFPALKKELAKYDIDVYGIDEDFNMGEGFWNIDVNLSSEEYEDYDIGVQLSYATNKAAKENDEDWEGGFALYNETGDELLTPITHDIKPIVKKLVKIKYGNKFDISQKIKRLKKELSVLENIHKIL